MSVKPHSRVAVVQLGQRGCRTLSAAVRLFDRVEAHNREIVTLASDHAGHEAVLRDDPERRAKDHLDAWTDRRRRGASLETGFSQGYGKD